jgi:hypothetical protein
LFRLNDWALEALRDLLPAGANAHPEEGGRITITMSTSEGDAPAAMFRLAFDEDAAGVLAAADEAHRGTMARRLKGEVAGALLRGLEYEERAGRLFCVKVTRPVLLGPNG